MRTLIFGGSGIVGRALVAEARRRGFAALGLAHGQADITDHGAVAYWMESFRPELVVNCAALTKVDACEERRQEAFAVNGEAVAHVAGEAARVGALLVQLSTDYVFRGDTAAPYREEAATGPLSVYGASKLAGERAALTSGGSGGASSAGGRALVLRTSWIFGDGGANFVATLVTAMARGERHLRVVTDQIGCPTYAPFLARALYDLVVHKATGILHYRNREPVSWFEFARAIAAGWDREVEVAAVGSAEFPRPAPRPAYSVLDVGRCERLLGRQVEPWIGGLWEYLWQLRQRRV